MGSWWPTSTSRDGSRISEKVGGDITVAHSPLLVFRLVFMVFVLKMLTNLQRPTAAASAVVEK